MRSKNTYSRERIFRHCLLDALGSKITDTGISATMARWNLHTKPGKNASTTDASHPVTCHLRHGVAHRGRDGVRVREDGMPAPNGEKVPEPDDGGFGGKRRERNEAKAAFITRVGCTLWKVSRTMGTVGIRRGKW
jgi:hypothetical protein